MFQNLFFFTNSGVEIQSKLLFFGYVNEVIRTISECASVHGDEGRKIYVTRMIEIFKLYQNL